MEDLASARVLEEGRMQNPEARAAEGKGDGQQEAVLLLAALSHVL